MSKKAPAPYIASATCADCGVLVDGLRFPGDVDAEEIGMASGLKAQHVAANPEHVVTIERMMADAYDAQMAEAAEQARLDHERMLAAMAEERRRMAERYQAGSRSAT